MKPLKNPLIGVSVFTILFPAMTPLMQYIPNPMVPGAIVSLNMILPVLAGHFYGPLSGLIAGGLGVWLAVIFQADQFYIAGVFSMAVTGVAAGWAGKYRSELLSASTIIIAHALNILTLTRIGLLAIPPEQVGAMALGLATETIIDVVAIVLIIVLLKQWLYQRERW